MALINRAIFRHHSMTNQAVLQEVYDDLLAEYRRYANRSNDCGIPDRERDLASNLAARYRNMARALMLVLKRT